MTFCSKPVIIQTLLQFVDVICETCQVFVNHLGSVLDCCGPLSGKLAQVSKDSLFRVLGELGHCSAERYKTRIRYTRDVMSSRPTWSRSQKFRPQPRPRSIRPRPRPWPHAMLASFWRRLSSWPSCHCSRRNHVIYVTFFSDRKLLLAL